MNQFFSKDLIWLDVDCIDQTHFFEKLSEKLLQLGYIKESYLSNILNREKEYPTGLSMPALNIAIPHTNPDHIVSPFIAVTKLSKPITFTEMGSISDQIEVQWIFALGVTDGKNQVGLLQNLVRFFSNNSNTDKLNEFTSSDELYHFFVETYQ